jgi:hypothetical protein
MLRNDSYSSVKTQHEGEEMSQENSPVAPVTSLDGDVFLVYAGPGETIFCERVRPSGRRDATSIFHFDTEELLEVVMRVRAQGQRSMYVQEIKMVA